MASTATTRLGLRKQGTGDNEDTWGTELNEDALDLIDEAHGVETVALTGNVTLSTTNYATNQARNMGLRLTDSSLSAAPTVTVPAKEKVYVVDNTTTYVVTFSCGGTDATVAAQRKAIVYCNGTNVYSQALFQSADQASYGGGLSYAFSTTTADADPGAGFLRFDNATQSSATGIYISDSEAGGADVSAYLLTWDDSTSTIKGFVVVQSKATAATFRIFSVSALTDQSGYVDLTVAHVAGNGTLANNEEVVISFFRAGDKGDPGGGFEYTFSTTTTDSDPGSGVLRLDNATASSATGIYADDNNVDGTDISAGLVTWDDSTSTVKGVITIRSKNSPAVFHQYSLASLADNSGYVDLTVTHVVGNGAFTNGERVYISHDRTGDKGDTGPTGAVAAAGDGTVSAPGIAFADDTNTGFYRTASGETSYSADGTRSFSIGSTGANLYDNTLQRPKLLDYGETLNAIGSIGGGTQDIDLELGNVVSGTVDTSETTFTFSNPPASGTAGGFVLYLTNGGSQTVNWPASVEWAGGTAPTLTTSGRDKLVFETLDGGTVWDGAVAALDLS